jgi:hypothetical protein
MKLVLGVLIATFVFSVAASAAPIFMGKFVLPEEVHWNHAVLPAGEYTIRMDSANSYAVLRSTRTNQLFYTGMPTAANVEKGGASLTITYFGNERKVRSLNLPELGRTLVFDSLTRTEKETLAKAGQTETIPVIAARK